MNDFMIVPKEIGSTETIEVPCKVKVYKCKYMNVTTEEDCLLYDQVKICGINEPEDEFEQEE